MYKQFTVAKSRGIGQGVDHEKCVCVCVQEHFGCDAFEGLELEDDGGPGDLSMPYIYASYHALYPCLISMPYIYALYPCLISSLIHAVYLYPVSVCL